MSSSDDWAKNAQRHGVDPGEVMQRAASQMQREAEQARVVQEVDGPPPDERLQLWVIVQQMHARRWRARATEQVFDRDVEAYGLTAEGAAGPQFRYQLAHVIQSAKPSTPWEKCLEIAKQTKINIADTRKLRE